MEKSKLKMIMLFVKGITTTIGASLILSQKYPVITLTVLGLGAGTVEVLNYMDKAKEI